MNVLILNFFKLVIILKMSSYKKSRKHSYSDEEDGEIDSRDERSHSHRRHHSRRSKEKKRDKKHSKKEKHKKHKGSRSYSKDKRRSSKPKRCVILTNCS